MQSLIGFAFLCFVTIGYIHAQGDEFIGLPEFDLYALDFRNEDSFQDPDIFNDPEPLNRATETIERLCAEYDILLDNKSIDCKKLRLVQRALQIDQHVLQKREAENDEALEGSGDGDEGISPEPTPTEDGPPQIDEVAVLKEEAVVLASRFLNTEDQAAVESQPDQADGQLPAEEIENSSVAVTEVAVNETEAEPEAEVEIPAEPEPAPAPSEAPEVETDTSDLPIPLTPIESELVNEVPTTEANEEEIVAVPLAPVESEPPVSTDDELVTPFPTLEPEEEDVAVPLGESTTVGISDLEQSALSTPEPKEEIPVAASTADANQEVTPPAPVGVAKKGRVLRPTPAVPKEASETDGDKTAETKTGGGAPNEAEKLNEHQSGNAIVDGASAGTLEGADKAVGKMEPNAEIKGTSSNSEEPKSGESAKETQKSRKDTKILIVLFVAVIVIGVAAFSYNYIKKRKQRANEATKEENGVNTVKRSLQDLTKGDDPEQGTELKPLMNNSDEKPVIADYTDEKGNAKPVETK